MRDLTSVLAMCSVLVACDGTYLKPHNTYPSPNGGYQACADGAGKLSGAASRQFVIGTVVGLAAGGTLLTGAALGPGDPGAAWYSRQRNLLWAGTGVLLGIVAKSFFDRSEAASDAAAALQLSERSPTDREAYENCSVAVAAWHSSRKNAISDLRELIDAQKITKAEAVAKKADEAAQKADEAAKRADEAAKKAAETTPKVVPAATATKVGPSG